MSGAKSEGRWRRAVRYTIGGVAFVVAVWGLASGAQWYWPVIGLCAAITILLGRRRILRAGVTRTPDRIVCLYVPWFEGTAYFAFFLLPVIAIASLSAGFASGNPTWLRFVGFGLLAVTPIGMFSVVSMWRRCILGFSASTLTIRTAAPKDVLTEVPRDRVQSITPKMIPNGVSGESLQVEIVYQTSDSGTGTRTVLLGLQLSVQPKNLLDALVAWKDATDDDPNELLDRIEEILRGRSPAVV